MTRFQQIKFITACLCLTSLSSIVNADERSRHHDGVDLLLNVTANYLFEKNRPQFIYASYEDREQRSRRSRSRNEHSRGRSHDNSYNRSYSNHYSAPRHQRDNNHGNRHWQTHNSYTSEPIRGGSSRRTRRIENPFPNRLVTGITLTGIDNGEVHLRSITAYPHRQYLSPRGYTLSRHHPERTIRTNRYMDEISVAAKRREYFTVTFHYD